MLTIKDVQHRSARPLRWFLFLLLFAAFTAGPAAAAATWRQPAAAAKSSKKPPAKKSKKSSKSKKSAPAKAAAKPAKPAAETGDPVKAELLMEVSSGRIIAERNADDSLAPASMVKMMTVLLVQEQLEKGTLQPDTPVTVSARASLTGGSQVYLKEGEIFTVDELLTAIYVHSANDACIALAEQVAGSADVFVDQMNAKAQELGLSNTVFGSVNGLPPAPGQPWDKSTARDMALLGRALITRFPHVLEGTKIQQTTFREGKMVLDNTNKLLKSFPGTDGIKTGFCNEAGFCVTATAERDGLRFIAVVMGGRNSKLRFDAAAKLLSQGFGQFERLRLAQAGQMVDMLIPVANGVVQEIRPVVSQDVYAVVERAQANEIILNVPPLAPLTAPVTQGTVCGQAVFRLGDLDIATADLVTPSDVAERSLWQRVTGWISGQ